MPGRTERIVVTAFACLAAGLAAAQTPQWPTAQDIDRALAQNEFFLEFQPVVDLTHRELLGVEALVRQIRDDVAATRSVFERFSL